MPDRMSEEDRSYTMSQIQSTGTEPEEKLGQILEQLAPEAEIREHADDLPGTPDFHLPDYDVALFADGCFFHRCPKHFQMPKSNRDYWEPKIERNCERDEEVDQALREQGIAPVRIWEHDLSDDLSRATEIVSEALGMDSES